MALAPELLSGRPCCMTLAKPVFGPLSAAANWQERMKSPCRSYFSVRKYSSKSKPRGKEFISAHSLRVWPVMARGEGSWLQESEEAGPVVFEVRKQKATNDHIQFPSYVMCILNPEDAVTYL